MMILKHKMIPNKLILDILLLNQSVAIRVSWCGKWSEKVCVSNTDSRLSNESNKQIVHYATPLCFLP